MIWFVIVLFALLFAGNYLVARSVLYPPAVFVGVWLASFLALTLSGDLFYPVSAGALLVYLVGALAFSAGGIAAQIYKSSPADIQPLSGRRQARLHFVLDLVLAFVVVGFPYYVTEISKGFDLLDPLYFTLRRQALVELHDSPVPTISLASTLAAVSVFVAMAMHLENDGSLPRQVRAYLAIALALLYGVLTGTKGVIVTLALSLIFITMIRSNRVNLIRMGVVVMLSIAVFGVALLFVNFTYEDPRPFNDTVEFVWQTIRGYWLAGIVAFDSVFKDPTSVTSTQHLNRFFLKLANSLGGEIDIPSSLTEEASVSPVMRGLNTYTIYFTYYKDHGWLGVVLGLAFLGWLLSLLFHAARKGSALPMLFYGMTMTGLVLSVQAEHFWLDLAPYLRAFIFYYSIYSLLSRIEFRFWKIRWESSALPKTRPRL